MTREQKIALCLKLHMDTQDGIAIPSEFTIGKYDFMLSEGFIMCPDSKRQEYFNKAKGEYQYELQNMVQTDGIVKGKTATHLLINMQEGKPFSFQQMKYLSDKVKIIALKEFMRNAKEIKFTEKV